MQVQAAEVMPATMKYSAEQVKLIRDALYTLGQIDYLIFKDKCNETGTGRNLHQSVNG